MTGFRQLALRSAIRWLGGPDWEGRSFSPVVKQATLGFTIDRFIEQFHPPFPTHIKIDVDRLENALVEGAHKILCDTRVKSLLIELNAAREENSKETIALIESFGMELVAKRHAPELDASRMTAVYNYIFSRPKPQKEPSRV